MNAIHQNKPLKEPVSIVVGGNVDAGKSTLLGQLLQNTDPRMVNNKETDLAHVVDGLSFERDNGVTLNSTQRMVELQGRQITFIDVPGHREFISQMVSGSSLAEIGILIIDALEPIASQTYKHLNVFKLLGIENLIIAVNKVDALQDLSQKIPDLMDSMQKLDLQGFASVRLCFISAEKNQGIFAPLSTMLSYKNWQISPYLTCAIDEAAMEQNDSSRSSSPMQSDSVFQAQTPIEVDAVGGASQTWIGGKVLKGNLKVGDTLFRPYAQNTKEQDFQIKQIMRFPDLIQAAQEGWNVSILFNKPWKWNASSPLFTSKKPDCWKNFPADAKGNDAENLENRTLVKPKVRGKIIWLAKKSMQVGAPYTLHLAGQKVAATVTGIESPENKLSLSQLEHAEIAEATFEVSEPLYYEPNNRRHGLGQLTIEDQGQIVSGGYIY